MFFSYTATLAPLCSGQKIIKSSHQPSFLVPPGLPMRFFYAPPGSPSPYLRLPDLPDLAPDVLGRAEDGGRTFEPDARTPRHEGKNCRVRGRWWVGLGTYAPWQRWQKTNVEVGIPEKTMVMSHNRGGQSFLLTSFCEKCMFLFLQSSCEICFLSSLLHDVAWL